MARRYTSAESASWGNDVEVEDIRELYRPYTREAEGITHLVLWLNRNGWRVKGTGNAWTVRTLSRFMDSGFAAGLISR